MIRAGFLLVAALTLVSCGRTETAEGPNGAGEGAPNGLSVVWTVTEGIETPESVYIDTASNSVFISVIAGAPDARDGNGRIVRLNMDGSVVATDWVSGLNAPKGLRAHEGTLWTADLDEVIGIDIASGTITSRVQIEDAQFLNDVAVGADGTVYVSDTFASRIYAVRDGEASVFVEGEDYEFPNGLLVEGSRLIVGGWGRPNPDFSTEVPGRLYSVGLEARDKMLITREPFGNIDGVESDGRGGFMVSDYMKGTILRVNRRGESETVAEFQPGTADIAFVPDNFLLVVPHMNENRVVAYRLPF